MTDQVLFQPRTEYLGTPARQGKIKSIQKFDHDFFKIPQDDANWMDPQVRILHETCYEAIVDAGIDPNKMRGSKTAVFIGHCYDDTDSAYREDTTKAPAYKQLAASRISYAFDFKGPVFCTDTACASSFSAFFKAICAMRAGEADSVLVCGAAVHLRPFTAVAFHNLKMLSDDGRSKCMDANADGYCRSEAVVSVLLQKKSVAKRIYATVLNTRTNTDGWKPEGITFPSYLAQKKLMIETYSEAGIDPATVEYMEAHMTGTPVGDPVESAAIVSVCCPEERKIGPLLVGCLKSNMGHTEGASGNCAITKACLVFQKKVIPPNLHLNNPNPNIDGLKTGVLKPVLETTPFDGDLIGVNSFGFGGCNVHAVLQANLKNQEEDDYKITENGIPRIINFCARTREGVDNAFKHIEENPKDVTKGFLSLINDFSKACPSAGMIIRGSAILSDGKIISKSIERVKEKRPLWVVFSALGCQWPGMAKALMGFKPFADSIHASKQIIDKHNLGFDLLQLVLEESQDLSNLLETFLALVSVQVALMDVLFFLDLIPDGIVGHSVGEIAAGYADGCMTREQTILTAYMIAKNAVQLGNTSGTRGGMAAVGLSVEKMQEKLNEYGEEENVFIGCINSEDTITLSGVEERLKVVVDKLVDEGIFAKHIDSCGIPFHCPLVQNTYDPITKDLEIVLANPKKRSHRWLSTSVPSDRWHEESCQVLGPTYFPNSMVSTVKFGDVFQYIPKNAVVVEVGPHAMLLSLIKRGLGPDSTCIPLMKKDNHEGNLLLHLSSIGQIYCHGNNPSIEKMYPKVSYPVPRETASLSPLLGWDHSRDLAITKFPDYFNVLRGDQNVVFDLMEQSSQYLAGHCIDGRILFPATGYLFMIWQRFAISQGLTNYEECPVEFFNVKFHRATLLSKTGSTGFKLILMPSNGQFTITEGGSPCVTGFIARPEDPSIDALASVIQPKDIGQLVMTPKEIYKELRVRGYDYGPTFQGLTEARSDGSIGQIKWLGNWISFTDSMLQMAILGKKERGLFLPTFIDYMKCDVKKLLSDIKANKNEMGESVLTAYFDSDVNAGCTNGMVIKGMKASPAPRRSNQNPTVESYAFIPYNESYLDHPNQEKERLKAYDAYCKRMLKDIEANITSDLKEDEGLKILLESNDDGNILAKTLWSVISPEKKDEKKDDQSEEQSNDNDDKPVDLPTVLIETIAKVENELSVDTLLTSSLTMEKLLRTQLDVVIENFSGKKMNIAEVSESDFLFHDSVSEVIESNLLVVNNYNLLHTNPEKMSKQHGVDASSLKPLFPTNLETDLLVINDASTKFATIKEVVKESKEGTDSFEFGNFLKSAATALKERSFILMVFRSMFNPIEEHLCRLTNNDLPEERLKTVKQMTITAEEAGLVVVSNKSTVDGFHSLLLRKPVEVLPEDNHVIIDVKVDDYSWVNELKEHFLEKDAASKEEKKTYKVWLIAQDTPSNGLIGLVNCLRREFGADRVRSVFRPPKERPAEIQGKELLTTDILSKDLIMNVYRGGEFGSFRHLSVETIEAWAETKDAFLDVKTKGDLSSLRWMEGDHKYWIDLPETHRNPKDLLCSVYHAALNFKDIMVATGRIPVDAYPADFMGTGLIGMEFSGKDQFGNRVLAFCPSKAISTTLLMPDVEFIWKVPDHWTMAEAATVPVVYVTVYYALFVRGKLRAGESVLIHAGSGGIGQAAISVCLAKGCQVFTTVGSQAKREFLLSEYPQLKESHIGNSRDLSFEEMVLRETDGRGVDLVLNSLADDKLQASVRCLADFGRFIEIGKYDIMQNNPLNLSDMGRNKTWHTVCVAHLDYDALVNRSPAALKLSHELHKAVEDGIANNEIRPLKYHVFEKDQTEEAFRFMATGKHMGKVLIKMRDDDDLNSVAPPLYLKAMKQSVFHPLHSFIITGGLGGFGLEVASWMITRGAKKIVLSSRSGVKTSFQELSIRRFREQYGAEITVSTNDCVTREGAKALIEDAQSLGPLRGIFHLAMVLKDATLENQTVELFEEACASKVQGTIHLDELSRELVPDLEHFVCFSSVVSGRGNIGQTNYGFANSVMERVCEVRRKDNLHGLAIQWGAIGDVGVVAESLGGNDIIVGGTLPQRIPSCMEVLDNILQSSSSPSFTVLSSIVKADKKRSAIGGKGDLLRQVCHILGVKDPSSLDPNTTLGDLGLDSLMAVEIRQALERDYDMVMTTQEIRQLKVKDIQKIGKDKAAAAKNKEKEDKEGKPIIGTNMDVNVSPAPQLFSFLTQASSGGRPIFFIPSIEGDFRYLQAVCHHVTRPIIGINWTEELDSFDSFQELAKFIVTKMKEMYPDSTYDILGQTYGSLIAFEMAVELQRQMGSKAITKLLFLDGSPLYCKKLFAPSSAFLSIEDESASHTEALIGFIKHYYPSRDTSNLKESFSVCSTKEERVKILAEYLSKDKNEISPVSLLSATERFFKKIRMTNSYIPGSKFVGDMRLLKPSVPGYTGLVIEDLPSDYGLSEVCIDTDEKRCADY